MKLNWSESHRGYGTDGTPKAEVTHIYGPDGSSHGWSVWLVERRIELRRRFPGAPEAKAAAEAALDQYHPT